MKYATKKLQDKVLAKAIELIGTPDKWRQGALAGRRDEELIQPANYTSSDADCFCATGAVLRAGYELIDDCELRRRVEMKVRDRVEACLPEKWQPGDNRTIEAYNDTHSHRSVLGVMRKALS